MSYKLNMFEKAYIRFKGKRDIKKGLLRPEEGGCWFSGYIGLQITLFEGHQVKLLNYRDRKQEKLLEKWKTLNKSIEDKNAELEDIIKREANEPAKELSKNITKEMVIAERKRMENKKRAKYAEEIAIPKKKKDEITRKLENINLRVSNKNKMSFAHLKTKISYYWGVAYQFKGSNSMPSMMPEIEKLFEKSNAKYISFEIERTGDRNEQKV